MDVEARRAQLRSELIGPRYSGPLHFAFTNALALGLIALAATQVHGAGLAWLTVPLTFAYANLIEYFAHRGPMHRPARGLRLVYKRHTLDHHSFFAHDAMAAASTRDWKLVLFPPLLIVFFFGLFALPAFLAVRLVLGANVAALFVITALSYFLIYEWLHLAYHSPRLAHLPGVAVLQRHHAAHHDPRLMSAHNFNITFPICDTLFGTHAPLG